MNLGPNELQDTHPLTHMLCLGRRVTVDGVTEGIFRFTHVPVGGPGWGLPAMRGLFDRYQPRPSYWT